MLRTDKHQFIPQQTRKLCPVQSTHKKSKKKAKNRRHILFETRKRRSSLSFLSLETASHQTRENGQNHFRFHLDDVLREREHASPNFSRHRNRVLGIQQLILEPNIEKRLPIQYIKTHLLRSSRIDKIVFDRSWLDSVDQINHRQSG